VTDTAFDEDISTVSLEVRIERHLTCQTNPEKQTGQHVLACFDRRRRELAIIRYPYDQQRDTPVPDYNRSVTPKTHKSF
jgi:hypothetical protein